MTRRISLLVILLLFMAGCSLPQGFGPQAWIDAPLDGSHLPLAKTEIVVHAFAAGTPKAVELTINGQPIAIPFMDLSVELATIKYLWNPAEPGRYVIAARTQNEAGDWSEFHPHLVIVGESTITPSFTPTEISSPTFTPTFTSSPTLTGSPTFTPTKIPGPVFSNLTLSATVFYHMDAMPRSVKFSIKVTDPAGIKLVEFYFRLRDPNTNETTAWTNEDMTTAGGGIYTYTLDKRHPAILPIYPNTMIVEYQFIVTHPDSSFIRSPVYNDVTLKRSE